MSQPKNTAKRPQSVNHLFFSVLLSVGVHSLFLVPFWKFGTIAMTLPEKPMQLVLELPLEASESSMSESAAPPTVVVPKRPTPSRPAPVPERPEVAVAPEPAPEPLPKMVETLPEPSTDVFESQPEMEPESVSRPQSGPDVLSPGQTHLAENPKPGAGSAQPARSESLSNIYLQHVYQRIQRAKRYPRFAREREMEGRTQVEFVLSRDGKLLESRVVNSSGHSLLDQEALLTLRRAAPFPKLPETIRAGNVVMNVVISFILQ